MNAFMKDAVEARKIARKTWRGCGASELRVRMGVHVGRWERSSMREKSEPG